MNKWDYLEKIIQINENLIIEILAKYKKNNIYELDKKEVKEFYYDMIERMR